ncbi:LINE-1 reverse transcriptase-like protein [Trifolium pratense]|uniref:LINE-1 reverse transcriptase-like protein n=1 Tax=Trifolium pratense TaxID=57577 RepID=A0A2K3P744_TRIPR|nr:LINE-1 reverse transcriptase-like protein [Trifolium pratense]
MCQNAFLPNLQILGVLVLNEVIDRVKRSKESCLLLKVDFERAYDWVNWNFLKYKLRRMGFCSIWIGWIMECVCSKSIYVLVNGSPTKEFIAGKGLKQGDPLAPFLFLIIAERLTGLVMKAIEVNLLKGYVINNTILFPMLQFVDDAILMCKGN